MNSALGLARMSPSSGGGRLDRSFFARDTREVARELLGARIYRLLDDGSVRSARIVETEAYHGFDDRASHAHRGPTPRNQVMFGPPGHAYVYLCYGIHHLLNFVTCEPGFPAAVLIRGVDRSEGFEDFAIGPGRLTRAMAITREEHDGVDLTVPETGLWVARAPRPKAPVKSSPRIGVDYAGRWAKKPWRYFLSGAIPNPGSSGSRKKKTLRG